MRKATLILLFVVSLLSGCGKSSSSDNDYAPPKRGNVYSGELTIDQGEAVYQFFGYALAKFNIKAESEFDHQVTLHMNNPDSAPLVIGEDVDGFQFAQSWVYFVKIQSNDGLGEYQLSTSYQLEYIQPVNPAK